MLVIAELKLGRLEDVPQVGRLLLQLAHGVVGLNRLARVDRVLLPRACLKEREKETPQRP